MNRWIVSGVFLLASALGMARQTLREDLQERYDQLTRLTIRLREKEVLETTKKWLTSDYVYQDRSGTQFNVEAFLEQSQTQMGRTAKYRSYTNKIIGVKVEGVSVVLTVKSVYDLEERRFGGSRLVGSSITHDYWVNTIHGWKMKKTVTISESNKQIPADRRR